MPTEAHDTAAVNSTATPDYPEGPSIGTCPFGNTECEGVSGLLMGDLPCWECFSTAPQSAVDFEPIAGAF